MALASIAALRDALSYDLETGVFTWKIAPKSHRVKQGAVAGGKTQPGYLVISFGGRLYKAHRLAWAFHYGDWPGKIVDHIDGNRLNNRIANLRDVSNSINLQNTRAARKNSLSGFLGVGWNKKSRKWRAQICIDGKAVALGYFDAPEEAHAAYLAAKRKHHPGCTI